MCRAIFDGDWKAEVNNSGAQTGAFLGLGALREQEGAPSYQSVERKVGQKQPDLSGDHVGVPAAAMQVKVAGTQEQVDQGLSAFARTSAWCKGCTGSMRFSSLSCTR